MNQQGFFDALTKYHAIPEPLNETTAVLCYEVGKMMEQVMYMKWHPEDYKVRMGFYKSEVMDAIAQLVLICASINVDFEEMKELGIEKAMERFTKKERK